MCSVVAYRSEVSMMLPQLEVLDGENTHKEKEQVKRLPLFSSLKEEFG